MRISDWSSDVCSSDLNSRNAVDRYRHAVMRDHVSRDSIDLLSKHPWPGAKMAAQQRARRRIEKYELSLGRQAAPLDEEGPVRQGVRRIDRKSTRLNSSH